MVSMLKYNDVLIQLGCFQSQDALYEHITLITLQSTSIAGSSSHIAEVGVVCVNSIDQKSVTFNETEFDTPGTDISTSKLG